MNNKKRIVHYFIDSDVDEKERQMIIEMVHEAMKNKKRI